MLVYVAGPYTKGDVYVNVRNAILAGNELYDAGHMPFIPHLNHFWHLITPRPEQEWLIWDVVWLLRCDVLLRLPGESKGADQEIEIAKANRIPVFYSMDDCLKEIGDVRQGANICHGRNP